MEDVEFEKLSKWVRDSVTHELDEEILQFQLEPFQTAEGQLASSMFQVNLTTKSTSRNLIAKVMPCGGVFNTRDIHRIREQFHNEITFLKYIVPFFRETVKDLNDFSEVFSIFPDLVCSREDEYQSLAMFEDLSCYGYKLTSKIMDVDHVKLAVKWLAKFHALSYAAKIRNPIDFNNHVKKIQNLRFEPTPMLALGYLVNRTAGYPIELFKEQYPEDYKKHKTKIDEVMKSFENAFDILGETTFPEEPLAVLCHGDFLRNNMMFRYDDHGHPVHIKFIDFQLMSYSSPAIDLAVLLYENTTPELRKSHLEKIFDLYVASVGSYLPQIENETPLNVVKKEFSKRAVHGFLIAALFLEVDNVDRNVMAKFIEDHSLDIRNPEDDYFVTKEMSKYCGEEPKRMLAAMCKEMLENNFL